MSMKADPNIEPINPAPIGEETAGPDAPVVVGVAAVRLQEAPNRSQRALLYTELGSFKLDAGIVRIYANKRSGSLMIVMPDRTSFSIDAGLAATQCYKYWLLTSGGKKEAEADDEAESAPSLILGLNGLPIEPGLA